MCCIIYCKFVPIDRYNVLRNTRHIIDLFRNVPTGTVNYFRIKFLSALHFCFAVRASTSSIFINSKNYTVANFEVLSADQRRRNSCEVQNKERSRWSIWNEALNNEKDRIWKPTAQSDHVCFEQVTKYWIRIIIISNRVQNVGTI